MRNRLIIDTDAKNEADDQFAIVHALLSPSIDVVGLIAAHFGTRRSPTSMEESRAEIDHLLALMGRSGEYVVANGAAGAMPDVRAPIDSDGARLIIREAERPGPLFIAVLGPLTDVASAILIEPSLVANQDLTIVWVGGHPYDGPYDGDIDGEFNAGNDVHAANVVLQSGIRVWQIPWTVYSQVGVGFAELEERVGPHGDLGRYLVDTVTAWNAENVPFEREVHSLGDSPAIGVVLNAGGARWRSHAVRHLDAAARLTARTVPHRTVRVADSVDTRWLLEDLFVKIARFAAAQRP